MKPADFGFARQTNSIPLNGIEFVLAVKQYPIVFTGSDPATPVAVVGLRDRENLYVRADGSWAPGAYVPVYVRRYPFILLENPERKQFTLCIEEPRGAWPMRMGSCCSKATLLPRPRFAPDFCTAFQGHATATRAFADAVAGAGLLVEKRAQSAARRARAGPDRVWGPRRGQVQRSARPAVLDWRRKGWLPLIYGHLISTRNWANLVDRVAGEGA